MRSVILLAVSALSSCFLISCSSENGTPSTPTYQLGEKAQVGPITYTVFERQWLTQLGTPGPDARIPQNRFFLIRLSALNAGGNDTSMPNLTLVDDTGHSFDEVAKGDGVPQWIGALRLIHPADSAQGNLVFDVAPQHYKLKLTDEEGKQSAFVDIPLTFDTEAPTLPQLPEVPAGKKR